MYSNYPNPTDVQLMNGSEVGSVKAILTIQPVNVPAKCADFLMKLGWSQFSTHPDTNEQLFHKPPPNETNDEEKKAWNYELQYSYWHWYEAMAYEFSKFMSIDEDTGGASGSDTMGSPQAPGPAGQSL